jgi:hypothetical protein
MKVVVFKDKYTEKTNKFYPLYMKHQEIDGTQWNLKNFSVLMPRMKETEY